MEQNSIYIKNLVKEIGIENAREEYLKWCFYLLDEFAQKKKLDDIFHLTADEYIPYADEIDNTIDFIVEYRNEVEGEFLGEIFDYILEVMKKASNYYPYQILGEFFDETTKK